MKPSLLFGLCLLPGCLLAAEPKKVAAPHASTHVMVHAAQTQWGDAPASLPKGAQAAVLSGDPGKTGDFTLRLKMPAGYRIPRHWHPTDEHVTVIEGDASLSMGDGADMHSADFVQGDYVVLPAKMRHEASSRSGAVVQVQGKGPFQINYVNPADDPRKATESKKATTPKPKH